MSIDTAATHVSFDALKRELRDLLESGGASSETASIIAENCASCERDGYVSHGVFRMPGYLSSLSSGWVNGHPDPKIIRVSDAYLRVDGDNGFAQVALRAADEEITACLERAGIALVAVQNTHHFSSLWPDVEPFARRGYVALELVVGGNPSVVPPGADTRVFGTNPMAFATPVDEADPMVWDFATSTMSFGDLTIARDRGQLLPEARGVDGDGDPTREPEEIIDDGGLLPFGGHKGALLMLMIEALAAGVTGGNFSTEADQEKPTEAITSNAGQFFIIIDPEKGGNDDYPRRMRGFIDMLREAGMERMPGDHRYRHREQTERDGIPMNAYMRDFFGRDNPERVAQN